jgi:hypothetical protein
LAAGDEPRPRRWRRVAARLALFLLVLALLVPVGIWATLRSPTARQAIVARVGRILEEKAGLGLRATDFSVVLRRGELGIEDLELSLRGHGTRPFLTVDRVRAQVRLGSLFGDRVRVESLALERPRLDLDAPLPGGDGSERSQRSGFGVDVASFELTRGAVWAAGAPGTERWMDRWTVDEIELRGSLLSDELRAELGIARVGVDSRHRPRIEAIAEARLVAASRDALTVEDLAIRGEGLDLTASAGEAGWSFELRASPARLFPDLTSAGTLAASGELTWAGRLPAGAVEVRAEDWPAELLEPWLPGLRLERLDLARTHIDIDAELEGDPARGELDGHARVGWRRGDERLLAASLRPSSVAACFTTPGSSSRSAISRRRRSASA